MTIEENKALVRRYFEQAPQNPDVCDQIFAHQVTWHALYRTKQPDFASSPEVERAAYQRHRQLWGGWCETIDDMIAEGDQVMVRWTFRGRHAGEYLGIPPTNNPLTFTGIYIFRIAAGRIAEVWNLWDRVGEWQQLGILPATEDFLRQAKDRINSPG
jgi:ketosteroid isomerase-like protein